MSATVVYIKDKNNLSNLVSNMDSIKDKVIDQSRIWYQERNIEIKNTRFPTGGLLNRVVNI